MGEFPLSLGPVCLLLNDATKFQSNLVENETL